MTLFTRAATTALTGLAIFGFASAAFAEPPQKSDDRAHVRLAQAVQDAGVRVIINDDYCHRNHGKGTLYGFYSGQHRVMLICPENAEKGEVGTQWTEEDYDTLRHEAVHLVQDCMDGKLDHQLQALTKDPQETGLLLLGVEQMAQIQEIYLGRGQSQHIVRMEWEAFGLASLNQPDAQVEAIKSVCSLRSQSTASPAEVK